jgi:ankyrin repeat protein
MADGKSEQFNQAIRDKDLPLVKQLSLDPEVDLNNQFYHHKTPFYQACETLDNQDVVRYLLDFDQRFIEYNTSDAEEESPFFAAAASDNQKVVEILLASERIDVNAANYENQTPLWTLARYGKMHLIKVMLASGFFFFFSFPVDDLFLSKYNTTKDKQFDTLKRDNLYRNTAMQVAFNGDHFGIVRLIKEYRKDPQKTRTRLRRELGYDGFFFPLHKHTNSSYSSIFSITIEAASGELFALVVFLSDGYFRVDGIDQEEIKK